MINVINKYLFDSLKRAQNNRASPEWRDIQKLCITAIVGLIILFW